MTTAQMKRQINKVGVVSAFGLFAICAAQAQQRTMAIYGDWTVSCVMTEGQQPEKSCGIVQAQDASGQAGVASQIGIGRDTKNGSLRLSIEVGANTWIPTGITLTTASATSGINAKFKWCISTRCLADVELSDVDVKTLKANYGSGTVVYTDASQAQVSIPVSFKGFSEALTAIEQH